MNFWQNQKNSEEVEDEGYENEEISEKLEELSSKKYDTVPTWTDDLNILSMIIFMKIKQQNNTF